LFGNIKLNSSSERIRFACAPVSWGIQDDPGPAWEQEPYVQVLEEIVSAGYTGTELGPYGYFPTDPTILKPVLKRFELDLISSFVPVQIADPTRSEAVVSHIRKVGGLLSSLGATLIVLSDRQTPERQEIAGRVPVDGSKSLTSAQWKQAGAIIREAEKIGAEFGLRTVFHPHVATHVETPLEAECLFDALAGGRVGLCLDTGHCVYGGGDPLSEAQKYRSALEYIHIKDVDAGILGEARRKKLNFEEAVGAGVFSGIGKGCIDFEGFFKFLDESRYTGWAIVEQDVIFGKSAVPPVENMRGSLSYLREVMAKLGASSQSHRA
jgi:inosose dehydratase